MKVLQLISSEGFFGAENVVLTLSKELIRQGICVHIGIFKNSQNVNLELANNARKANIPVEIFKCRNQFDMRTIYKLRKFINRNSIDIVHSHGYKSNFYSFFANLNTKAKKVSTCHNWLGNSLTMRFYKALDIILLTKFNKVIFVSEDIREEVIKRRIRLTNTRIINNGVDLALFRDINLSENIRISLGINKEEKIIGAVGRLTEEKGYYFLLEAAQNIVKEHPQVKFLIAGDGPLKNDLESKAQSLALKEKIIFAGTRNDIPALLNLIDIFVMPSLSEGMPMALLEALASKKPAIATNVGAIPKIIKNGYSGIIFEPMDSTALANSIIFLLHNDKEANLMAQRGYETVMDNFSSTAMSNEYLKLYQELN